MSILGIVGGIVAGFLCIAAGMLSGGSLGYYIGLGQAAHASSADWFDTRGLYPFADAIAGGVIGAVIGGAAARASKLVGTWRIAIVGAFLILAVIVGVTPGWQYQRAQDEALLMDQRSVIANAKAAAAARQAADFQFHSLGALQYPGAQLRSQKPGDPIVLSSSDAPRTVVEYYQRVLATPFSDIAYSSNSNGDCWRVATKYQGAPLQMLIASSAGKTSILIAPGDSTTNTTQTDAATFSQSPPPPVTHEEALAAQRTKIAKVTTELRELGYPNAQALSEGDPTLILNFTTPDSVDAVGAYYHDTMGFALRRVQGKNSIVWVGDVVYHDLPLHIAVFTDNGVTRIQMT